ncbi:fido (protein-threonine AMPylation protein) [Rhodococcus rhodochrous J38]|uniref:Fic/DOC family protein n=1 Tax=Rhodococcus rhodochrous TaxID=1829 RepID=UPI00119D9014|nr:Fic family protein [Rhodococcus rhodochrous]TWH52654.1 fido (protein-threonine AMPylation protein) [Rhodococcus rhodochrous J38]
MTGSAAESEGYIPGTDVRINLLGITDARLLERIEDRAFAAGVYEFAQVPSPEKFTGDFLREIHRRGLYRVYSWAGQYKTVATTQGNLPITHSSPEDTATDVEELFADLAAENNLTGLDHRTFVTRLADYWARLTEIHPFPDGNSRSQFELFRRVAIKAGWVIDTDRVDLAALSAARYVTAESGDPRLLADVLTPAVVPVTGYAPIEPAPGRPVFSLVSHLAMMRDYDRDRRGPYTATETFREVTRERSLSGAELDNAHALVRIGLNLAERTDYGPEHDAAVRRILEGTSTLAAERAAAALPEPNHRYKDLFDPAAGKNTMRYDTGAPVNAFDERDPARLRRLITWELALRTADYLAHRDITGDGSELHASVIHRELHTDFMPIVSDTPAYTNPVIAAPDKDTLTDPHQLGRHIAAIQEETEGVQSVAVVLMTDQLVHDHPGRTIDWRTIDPDALRAATHAANYHDDPPEGIEPDPALEDAMRVAGREAFAAELDRAITTELPAAAPDLGTVDAAQRYERHWDALAHRSYALLENSLERNETYEPLTTAIQAAKEPRHATSTRNDDAPEAAKPNPADGEPHRNLIYADEVGEEQVPLSTAKALHGPPQVHHTPPQPNSRPPAIHEHQPPTPDLHLRPQL